MPANNALSPGKCETIAFSEIDRAGAYLLIELGLLMRVPNDGIMAGRSPCISLTSSTPIFVVRLSENPWLTISEARKLAAQLDLPVSF